MANRLIALDLGNATADKCGIDGEIARCEQAKTKTVRDGFWCVGVPATKTVMKCRMFKSELGGIRGDTEHPPRCPACLTAERALADLLAKAANVIPTDVIDE